MCLILGLLLSFSSYAEFIGVNGGYSLHRLNYLPSTGELDTTYTSLEADFTDWRRKSTGIGVRGPSFDWQQGSGLNAYRFSIPLFHWHKHHGIWVGREYLEVENQTAINSQVGYLGSNGSPVDLGSGSDITSTWETTRTLLFWQSGALNRGVANQGGLYWQTLTSPVEAELTNLTPEIFDGESRGMGLFLGRYQDKKGFNFQWRLYMGQQIVTYSEANNNIDQFSQSDRRLFQFEGILDWHYRYYLSPYWYAVPLFQFQGQLNLQSKSNSDNLKQKTLFYGHWKMGISLRRYF